ncbi:hypothetical protein G9A89_018733 [Geosiphon pyriformis]|nr:hypothetical protein G9A89_018733 [Geosiphon pyriformis]
MCGYFKPITMPSAPLIEFEEEKKKPTWEAYQVSWANTEHNKLLLVLFWDDKKKGKKKDILEETTITEKITKPTTTISHAIENVMATQKNKESETMSYVLLAANGYLMKECNYCLISCNFQYCNECDFIYNSLIYIIYMIPEEKKPISSCTLELESIFNPDSNFNNDDNNNTKQYIVLSDLTKDQKLKWFSNNDEGIMPECAYDTDAEFNLRYLRKDFIKLESHLHICIDLKIALEISATTIVQLTSRSSLAKKGINIKEGIIDAKYVENIIAMLQNDSKKAYIIKPNKKIAQMIFLSLVKIAQLKSMRNKEELEITVKRIEDFRSMGRIDVPINMAKKKIIDKGEIIFICQSISIPPYNQYIVVIERKVKNQVQIFEAETTLCELGKIGLVNLYIPAKNHKHIKISIYNNMGNIIEILERTTIKYLTTEIEDQLLNTIPDFSQLYRYVDIISQIIYEQKKCYLLQPEQLEQMNLGNLDSLQCIQFKMLLNNFNNIFVSVTDNYLGSQIK